MDSEELVTIQESSDYQDISKKVINSFNTILKKAFDTKNNKIIVNTSLKKGLPKENINKIAGPIIEAWVQELFEDIDIEDNDIDIINVDMPSRLHMADLIVDFNIDGKNVQAYCDVKSTSYDIKSSGKSPNVTSYARIRDAYTKNPNFIFIIISLKHSLTTLTTDDSEIIDGFFEMQDFKAYDLKNLSDNDISYNPSLGTGQLQIKNIHDVENIERTSSEFCEMLDKKYINSSKRTKEDWLAEARKHKWVIEE